MRSVSRVLRVLWRIPCKRKKMFSRNFVFTFLKRKSNSSRGLGLSSVSAQLIGCLGMGLWMLNQKEVHSES